MFAKVSSVRAPVGFNQLTSVIQHSLQPRMLTNKRSQIHIHSKDCLCGSSSAFKVLQERHKTGKLLACSSSLPLLSQRRHRSIPVVVEREELPVENKSLFREPLPNFSDFLTDTFGREHTYLRISLTERCNLRCQYCMPAEGVPLQENSKLLTTEEIIRLARIFAEEGVTKIKLTGGEPLVRKDIQSLIGQLKEIQGIENVGITTNGIVLKRHLPKFKDLGLDAINISLDTLVPAKFLFMTRRNGFEKVMESIQLAVDYGIPDVKINCVVMKNFNGDEIVDFVALTKDLPISIRFIEYMPFSGNKWSDDKFMSYKDMLKVIEKKFTLNRITDGPNDTSKGYRAVGHKGTIGFITSMSENFCGTCNRLRLTADGNLKACLFSNGEVNLRDKLRSGNNDQRLKELIGIGVKKKAARHAGMHNLTKLPNRPMILIGG